MKIYTVRRDDTPQKIAQGFTGDPSRFSELIAANPQLRTKIVGRDMQTGKMVVTFLDSDFVQGMKLNIPNSWLRSGSVGSSGAVGAGLGESCDSSPWNWCEDPYTCQNGVCAEVGGSGGGGGGQPQPNNNTPPPANCSYADICNPATDCWDEAACKAQGGTPGSNFCSNPNMIKTVQTSLGIKVDGIWGCDSQNALDASGQTFYALAGQQCQDPVPHAANCGGGGPGPQPSKKKEGEACNGTDECDTGLECVNGKCSKLVPAPKTSNLLWWVLGGLGAGACVVGVAYAGGAFDDKGKGKKAAAA